MAELKPCSRCECGDIHPQIELIQGTWVAWCEGCHTSTASKDRDECIKDWNTRPIEDDLRAALERLVEALRERVAPKRLERVGPELEHARNVLAGKEVSSD